MGDRELILGTAIVVGVVYFQTVNEERVVSWRGVTCDRQTLKRRSSGTVAVVSLALIDLPFYNCHSKN